MALPTTSWDETSPAGNSDLNLGDNRIREMKTQLREVIGVDHVFASSGTGDDTGKHNQVSLVEQADIGSGDEGLPILGAQTIAGKPELVYTDEDDNDVQITKDGKLNAGALGSLADVSPVGSDAFPATVLKALYPVGIVLTFGVSTNPNTLFGFGTWTAIAGKVIVGIDATQTEFDTLDETGGAKTHTLTEAEMPAHTHSYVDNGNTTAGSDPGSGATQAARSATTGSTGGGGAHNNLQPYIVKYVWQRTA